jgi:signal transduction histidine kinase
LEAIRTSVETAAAATDRVTTVVRRLRCFARLDEASDQEVDVRDCLDAAVAVLERSLSGVTLTVEARTGPRRVRGDPQALNQVFFELLANAAEATGSKGHITARIRATEAAVEAEVEDDGPGLSAEHLDRLFDPGFTTKAPGVGVGLGLASAHAIVTEHGGTIAAEPREGRGARFVVRLPASKVG